MNSPKIKILSIIVCALSFTALFYKQSIGINLLLFESLIIGLLAASNRFVKSKEVILTTAGTAITALMVVVHNSSLSIAINLLSVLLMVGVLLSPNVKSLIYSGMLAAVHLAVAQYEFFKQIGALGATNSKLGRVIRWIKIGAIPLFVIIVFIAIYSAANPVFDGLLAQFTDRLDAVLTWLSEHLEFGLFWFFIFGMLVSDFLLLKTTESNLERSALLATDNLVRKKKLSFSQKLNLGLKLELRSGILLVAVLNLLLLLLNGIDIYWVWFNFEWEGDYLKQFVHEGTYLLIISILISIAISMYLFRGNQNFYSKSKLLKSLTVLWLGQNALLALSVGMRNIHYIEHYALAHLRIGVFFFLVATLVGLAIVIIKIRQKKTVHFVTRTNAFSAYAILVIMTLVNWDVVIAKYNFKHYQTTFTHLNFLAYLSYATLPEQHKSIEFLSLVEESNQDYPKERSYIDKWEYELRVDKRIADFKADWEARDWRSWNWAYARTYDKLEDMENGISSDE
ncbi:MAG: DUF4173 domain-containing protein [Flavobacteriales bacterium]